VFSLPRGTLSLFKATGPGNGSGQTNSATVSFAVANSELVVTLSNAALYDPNDDQDILTAIFFKVAATRN